MTTEDSAPHSAVKSSAKAYRLCGSSPRSVNASKSPAAAGYSHELLPARRGVSSIRKMVSFGK